MLAELYSFGVLGMNSFVVKVEADISKGMPSFDVVGLPDASVKEARGRVRAALKNSGFLFPIKKITINLAPADIKKAGSIYDLPILISILKASKQLNIDLRNSGFVGELSLSGELRSINGVLPMVIKAREIGIKNFYLPKENAKEGSIVDGINIFGIENIVELLEHFNNSKPIEPEKKIEREKSISFFDIDYSQVCGQFTPKRALEIAAAGGHNVILIGPPGSGKSMLAKRIPTILPDMTFEESIETTKIHSIAGILEKSSSLIKKRPFRSPHHTISAAGLAGGGNIPHPGEISLSHNGVLFLDELPEFSRVSLEVLRQPIEDSKVVISRVSGVFSYPCSVMLICAMNPCPCGYFGHKTRPCTCHPKSVSNYLSRVSGPLLDRLDIHIEVPAVKFDDLSSKYKSESSFKIKERVNNARKIQLNRYKNTPITCNAKIPSGMVSKYCKLSNNAKSLIKSAFETLGFSARAYDKVLKVARTIADLDKKEIVESLHISEAVQYRSLDKKYWFGEQVV